MLHNLSDAVYKSVAARRRCLRITPESSTADSPPAPSTYVGYGRRPEADDAAVDAFTKVRQRAATR